MKTGSLRRLLGYTFRYKWSFFISVIGFISFAFADIAAVEWIRRIIGFINSEEENFSSFLALSLILIALGRGVGFFVGNYFMSRVGFGIVHDLRAELFQKLHDLPKSYFDANQSGQLINRITFTTTQVSGAASNAVKTLIREGFLLIGLFVYLLILNFKLTLLLIGTAPLIALIVYVAGKRLKKLAKKIQTAMGDVTHIASEAVDGHVEIKSFNAQEYENSRFLEANTSNKNQNLKLEATGNMATPIIQVLVSISLSIVAYFALGAQLGISLDAETFVAFFTAAGLMAKPIRQLSNIKMIVQKGLAAANEIFEQLVEDVETQHVQINSVLVRDVTLPANIKAAIERKLTQEQEALEYVFRLEKARQEAEKLRIDAEGKANANRILNSSLTSNILRDKGIEATLKLAESPNSKVVVVGSGENGGLPLILGNQ